MLIQEEKAAPLIIGPLAEGDETQSYPLQLTLKSHETKASSGVAQVRQESWKEDRKVGEREQSTAMGSNSVPKLVRHATVHLGQKR